MASTLTITTSLNSNNQWEVNASITPGGTLPLDIFIYSNTGTNQIGEYQGVTQLDDYQRLQTFNGSPIPLFANKYVKYTQAKIIMDISEDPTVVVNVITQDVQALSTALKNTTPLVQTINIT